MISRPLLALAILIFIGNCKLIPKVKRSQVRINLSQEVSGDTLYLKLRSPMACPLRMSVNCPDDSLQQRLQRNFPAVLPPMADTSFAYFTELSEEELKLRFTYMIGDPRDSIALQPMELPFPRGRTYTIIQGYNGKFSHQSDYSRYAIDFSLEIGDTVCAAADGYVVGVIEGYEHGGNSQKWRDYANFITLFHPDMNVFSQYVHLMHNGSFVEVGDSVYSGMPIGMAGMTGFTSVEHLHFNVLKASEKGIVSTPVEFVGGISGEALKKGNRIKK